MYAHIHPWMTRGVAAVAALSAMLAGGELAHAQVLPTGVDASTIQDLVNQFTGGGATTTGTETTTTGTGTTGTIGTTGTLGGTITGGLSGGRTPLVTNQFAAQRGGSIAERRPGLQIQTALAVARGDNSRFTNTEQIRDPSFLRVAFEEIILAVLDGIRTNLEGLNLFGALGGLSGLGGLNLGGQLSNVLDPNAVPNQGTVGTFDGMTTVDQGTVTVVP